jgi:hypothetical protein
MELNLPIKRGIEVPIADSEVGSANDRPEKHTKFQVFRPNT